MGNKPREPINRGSKDSTDLWRESPKTMTMIGLKLVWETLGWHEGQFLGGKIEGEEEMVI